MSRILAVLWLSISLTILGISPKPVSASEPLAENWVGAVIHANRVVDPILIKFSGSAGTLSIQPKTATQSISNVKWDGIHLEFQTGDGSHFVGQLDGAQVTGYVQEDGPPGQFVLLALLPLTDAALSEFEGVYRFATGEALSIQPAPSFESSGLAFFWPGLALNNFGNGAVQALYPIAKDVFFVGIARVVGYPFSALITFERNAQGKISGLRWQTHNAVTGKLGDEVEVVTVPVQRETVHYTSSDGIKLTGMLTLPTTPGTHPAMVVIHGSERGMRDDFGRHQMSDLLVSQGFAVLTYDKRGVGDSEGVYQERAPEAYLKLLAQDALAGVSYLKGRSEVDVKHIGLIGDSQAGWVIPLAANSADVRFFVIQSGPVVSVGIENQYSRYTNNGDTPTSYTSEELSKLLAGLPPFGFDPVPILPKLDQPGLWLWGDQDKNIPVPESVANLKKLIAQGKSNFSYQIFKNADHNLQQTVHGFFDEIPYSSGYPDGYNATLAQWLQMQIKG